MLDLAFITEWGGAVAAAIAIALLVYKSPWYWVAGLVNVGLWFVLFLESGNTMLAGLQVTYMLFSFYGLYLWLRHKSDGYDGSSIFHHLGTMIAVGIFAYTVLAFLPIGDRWWWVEFAGVAISIAAQWLSAFKYRINWVFWSATNVLFIPLFYHYELYGPMIMSFVYQAMCVWGWIEWTRDQRRSAKLEETDREAAIAQA